MTTTIHFRTWSDITDVPCPVRRCAGALRWAEAGYVSGYRICDGCGTHFALAGDVLTIARRGRVRDAAAVAREHAANAAWAAARQREISMEMAAANLLRHADVGLSVRYCPDATWLHVLAAAEPELWETAQQIAATLPQSVSLLGVTRDGRALLYREYVPGRQMHGGTWVAPVTAIAPPASPSMLADAYCAQIGATAGYIPL